MAQLRGEKLKEAIKQGICELAAEAGKGYVYNATHLAKHIGTSRVTLNSYKEFIDEVLDGIKADRRKTNNEGLVNALYDRIERLERERSDLQRELDVMRKHHADIFLTLYMNSVDGAALVEPIVKSAGGGSCILCGTRFNGNDESQNNCNVVKLNDE